MDEEISIINSNTRNERVRNFFVKNKIKIISILLAIIIVLIAAYSFDKYKTNQKIEISNKFNSTTLMHSDKNKESTIKNLVEIIQFSMGALLNNILDHSMATKLYYKLYLTYDDFHMILNDNGNGIFGHINYALKLGGNQNAAIELAKGRITTDEENHSGDELNSVFHLFDKAKIESNGMFLNYVNKNSCYAAGKSIQQKGTRIHLRINPESRRTCQGTFKKLFDLQNG